MESEPADSVVVASDEKHAWTPPRFVSSGVEAAAKNAGCGQQKVR